MTIPFHQLAAIAYFDEHFVAKALEQSTEWGDVKGYNEGGTQGYIASSEDDDLILVFRGTEPDSVEDWFADLDVSMVDNQMGDGRIHRGFSNAIEDVFGAMHSEITRRNPLRIFAIGHSLGAALATLACARLSYHGRRGIHLSTYGCPRVGNGKFARWLAPRLDGHHRFVNCTDLVTRVPHFAWGCRPPFIQGVYSHIGKPHYIASDGSVIDSPPLGFITFDRLRHHRMNPLRFFWSGIKSHSMWDEYCTALDGDA